MFSEIIDEALTFCGRRDKRTDAIRYLNLTIRECQVQAYFSRDLIEDELTPDATPYIWTRPDYLRVLRAVNYSNVGPVRNLPPGRIQEENTEYYYGASSGFEDDYFVFAGADTSGSIAISYYQYLRSLAYYETALRPATYDYTTETWTYLTAVTTAEKTAARNLVGNWMLKRWRECCLEGTLCKLLLVIDDPRGPKHYSTFLSAKKNVLQGETFESLDA